METLHQNLSWLLTILFLGVYTWRNYNSPSTSRSGTTLLLFLIGGAIYFAMVVVIWLISYTILHQTGLKLFGIGQKVPELESALPALAAMLLALGMVHPKVREMDVKARRFCHGHAGIPGTATHLGNQLARFTPFPITAKDVDDWARRPLEAAKLPVPVGASLRELPPAEKAFLRAVILRHKLLASAEALASQPPSPLTQKANKRLAEMDRQVQAARHRYLTLLAIARDYHAATVTRDAVAETLTTEADILFDNLCDILARLVLVLEWTERGRLQRLQSLGFQRLAPLPTLAFDHLVALALAAAVPLMVLQPLLAVRSGCPELGCTTAVFMVALEFLVAALTGSWMAFRVLQRNQHQGPGFPPLAAAAAGALLAFALTLVLRIVLRVLALAMLPMPPSLNTMPALVLDTVREHSAFLLFPTLTSALVTLGAYYLSQGRFRARYLVPAGGILGAAALWAIGLFVASLRPEAPGALPLVAAAIGALFGSAVLPCFKLALDAARPDVRQDAQLG